MPDFRAAKARLHDKLGAFQRQRERWTEAEQSFRQAIALQMSLVQQFPAAAYYGIWLATFRIALADALLQRNQPGAARTELEGTLATLVGQLEQRPELHPPHDLLAMGYARLEIALRQLGARAGGPSGAPGRAGTQRRSPRPVTNLRRVDALAAPAVLILAGALPRLVRAPGPLGLVHIAP